ncbi:expressed unknown protein [Seminavis robusta]|uniref:Uncharacterized protein n=1 Tax=Seminavis robusta TaxID=568900 RepID=A0A9N8EXM5_9STRA|nr:expressed unknown protein [Seminavis robusta]|eukprot:Sro2006_g310610.1 n/a (463) ;mRNA; r:15945-17333
MVLVGNYSVQLVHAKTKEPFKEHLGPDGVMYAEVEPGMDYFVELQVVGGDPKATSFFRLTVDRQRLNYGSFYRMSSGKQYKGLVYREKGVSVKRAFSFQKCSAKNSGKDDDGAPEVTIGDVMVEISEAIRSQEKTRKPEFWYQPMTPQPSLSQSGCNKALRSKEGYHAEQQSVQLYGYSYKPGKLLETVTIKYGTAWGLMRAGVLARPEECPLVSKQQKRKKQRAAKSSTHGTSGSSSSQRRYPSQFLGEGRASRKKQSSDHSRMNVSDNDNIGTMHSKKQSKRGNVSASGEIIPDGCTNIKPDTLNDRQQASDRRASFTVDNADSNKTATCATRHAQQQQSHHVRSYVGAKKQSLAPEHRRRSKCKAESPHRHRQQSKSLSSFDQRTKRRPVAANNQKTRTDGWQSKRRAPVSHATNNHTDTQSRANPKRVKYSSRTQTDGRRVQIKEYDMYDFCELFDAR